MLTNIRSAFVRRFFLEAARPTAQEVFDSKAVRRAVLISRKAHKELELFVNENSMNNQFVSLGQNCSTAWYLKQVGVKLHSYPFDWIFSSCDIVEDCIASEFSYYRDISQVADNGNDSAGHRRYHNKMFNHRSPVQSETSATYYQRCCDRFLALLSSDSPCVFVLTLLNESKKRVDWANGFTKAFPLPENQNLENVKNLMELITSKNPNSRFVVIEQYTDQDHDIKYERLGKDAFYIKYFASGGSSGTQYINDLDDFSFRLMMSALA